MIRFFVVFLISAVFLFGCRQNAVEQQPTPSPFASSSVPTATPEATAKPPPTHPPLPSPESLPPLIVDLSPPASSTIPKNLYQSNLLHDSIMYEGVYDERSGYQNAVCIALEFAAIDFDHAESSFVTPDFIPFKERRDRIRIFMDDKELTNLSKDLWWGPSGHTLCWTAEAEVGIHRVDFQLNVIEDDIRHYSWYFAISDEIVPLETMTPLP